MLKSISMHRRDNKWIVKFNFVTSCLAFSGLIPTNSHQSQKQTGHCRKNLLHNHITILYYYTKLGSTSSLCVFFSSGTLVLQNLLPSHCYHLIGSQTIQSRELPISQKASFVAIEVTKTIQSVHIPRDRLVRVLIKLKV